MPRLSITLLHIDLHLRERLVDRGVLYLFTRHHQCLQESRIPHLPYLGPLHTVQILILGAQTVILRSRRRAVGGVIA
jgi:hypothetical protein